MVSVVRGTLTALVVVLCLASGGWTAPVGAAPGSVPDTGTASGGPIYGASADPAVTTPEASEMGTVVNTTNTTDAENTTNTTVAETTVTMDASVEDGTASGSIEAESDAIDGLTAEVATNGSVSGRAVDTELTLLYATATGDSTTPMEAGTTTPTETARGNTSTDAGGTGGGAPDSGTDSNVPGAAAGAVLVGFGAAAVTLLVRRSTTLVALLPDLAATVSRLPSPLAQFVNSGREWVPRVLAAVGYSRYDDSDPLTHATRAELYELIAASPGTYLSELSEQADVPTSTVRHHLDVLVREGVVTTANVRGRRRYFSLDAGDETLAAALSDDASAAVIECLAEAGPASVSAIAQDLDRDVSTVSHHLGRLAEDDLVERERDGRSVYNELSPEVEEALGDDSSGRPPRRA